MSLATNLASLATRLATECKTLRSLLNGNASNLSALTTTAKSNLVAAINELQGEIDALAAEAAGIDDDVASSASTYSSSKVVELLDELKDELLGSGAAAALDTIGELAAALGERCQRDHHDHDGARQAGPLRRRADADLRRKDASAGQYRRGGVL